MRVYKIQENHNFNVIYKLNKTSLIITIIITTIATVRNNS